VVMICRGMGILLRGRRVAPSDERTRIGAAQGSAVLHTPRAGAAPTRVAACRSAATRTIPRQVSQDEAHGPTMRARRPAHRGRRGAFRHVAAPAVASAGGVVVLAQDADGAVASGRLTAFVPVLPGLPAPPTPDHP
jgi:hypothetical protein